MASALISYGDTPLAVQVRSAVQQLQQVADTFGKLKGYAEMGAAGADWAGFKSAFGVGYDADVQAVYNLITGVSGTLHTDANITQMLSRMP
jgi:hypothetical protein